MKKQQNKNHVKNLDIIIFFQQKLDNYPPRVILLLN